jgi:hypothetical protein
LLVGNVVNSWRERLYGSAPIGCKVFPCRVHAFDQCNTFGPVQAFDLFLAPDGISNVLVLFEIDEAIDLVSLRETRELAAFVLEYTVIDTVSHPGVDAPRFAGDYVHPEAVFTHEAQVKGRGEKQ